MGIARVVVSVVRRRMVNMNPETTSQTEEIARLTADLTRLREQNNGD